MSPLVPLVIALGAGRCTPSCTPLTPNAQNSVSVDALLKEVHIALNVARPSLDQLHLPLKTATLNLQTVATSSGGGAIQLWVVSLGHSLDCEATQEIVLTLVPATVPRSLVQPKVTFGEQLAKAIVSASEAVQKDQDPQSPLKLRQLSASVAFGVVEETKGGGKFTIVPVTAGLEGSVKNKALQKVTLVFE